MKRILVTMPKWLAKKNFMEEIMDMWLVRETEKAILVVEDGGLTDTWLPKSQIEYKEIETNSLPSQFEIN